MPIRCRLGPVALVDRAAGAWRLAALSGIADYGGVHRRQARPVQPRKDREVTVDGRVYRVKIRPRFQPAREIDEFEPVIEFAVYVIRWLVWSLPARVLRRARDRHGWTVAVYEARHGLGPRRKERLVHSERCPGVDEAVERADALVEELEDQSLS